MNSKLFIKIAGFINLIGALIHTIFGQTTLVNPLIESHLDIQSKTEWLGVWHMVTIILFATTYVYLNEGFKKQAPNYTIIMLISWLYVLFSVVFVMVNVWQQIFAPQWILLLPVGIFGFLSIHKSKKHA